MKRRDFLASSSVAVLGLSGCTAPSSSPESAHWVTVYLGEREETHDVTVSVKAEDGQVVFEQSYHLSDSNEAEEDAPFPTSTDPETVVVTVDGTRFERDWPGFEERQLPCDDPNRAGITLWVEDGPDGEPTLRLEPDCQYVPLNETTGE